jgi:UDP-GlcNAc:undecaprenyl-phosphate GlcNAc-1-phosphate transferase
MGDAGSTLLGFLLAGLSLLAIQPSSAETLPPAVVLWLLPVPILELFTSTFRRAVTGLSPMKADRGHFHHRLRDAGFSVRAIFILYLGTSTLSALAGIWAWRSGVSEPTLFYTFLAFSCVWLVLMHHVRRIARFLPRALRRASFAPLRRRSNSTAVGSRR